MSTSGSTSGSKTDPLSCQELVELVTLYLDHALSAEDAARFDEHLSLCRGCRTYLDQMRVTISTLGALPREGLQPDMRARLMDAFRDWKRR
ncbi:MAG TPA: zf-HC2 domain-containing protein [Ktedonobacterales bacterium]